jgi:hypothetical protein
MRSLRRTRRSSYSSFNPRCRVQNPTVLSLLATVLLSVLAGRLAVCTDIIMRGQNRWLRLNTIIFTPRASYLVD